MEGRTKRLPPILITILVVCFVLVVKCFKFTMNYALFFDIL